MLRWLPTVLMACLCSSGLASFELMLVADSGNDEVDRYDPETGTYLGSFGRGYLITPTYISINQATNTAFVGDSGLNRVVMFNYNTGAYMGSFSAPVTPNIVRALSNGQVVVSAGGATNSVRMSTAGTVLQTINTSGFSVAGIAQTGDGTVWFLGGDSSTHTLHSSTIGSATATLRSSWSSLNGLPPGYLSGYGNQLSMIEKTSYPSHRLTSIGVSGTSITSLQHVNITESMLSPSSGTAIGHNGIVYGWIQLSLSTGKLYRYMPGAAGATFTTLTNTTTAESMAIVVAPEPASMVGLALGAAFLARRRRKS